MGTQITDLVDPKLKKLISMCMESTLSYKIILKRLERDARVNLLFHNDLSHIQQYLFSALKIEPTSKVEVDYKEYNTRLIRTTAIHEHDGAPMEEYENVKNILARETVFPISIEQYYKSLVLLPNRGQ